MIDYAALEERLLRLRDILDWLGDLLNRAIRDGEFEKATHAYTVMTKLYAGPNNKENRRETE